MNFAQPYFLLGTLLALVVGGAAKDAVLGIDATGRAALACAQLVDCPRRIKVADGDVYAVSSALVDQRAAGVAHFVRAFAACIR